MCPSSGRLADNSQERSISVSQASYLAKRIVAVIPTLNEEKYIEACIRSLMCGDDALADVQLLVVDGGSSDQTVSIVEGLSGEFPNLSVVHNPRKLQAAAMNIAAETAPEPCAMMVRCDAHSIYPENFILTVCETLDRTGAASVVVPMDAVGEGCFQLANAWVVDSPLGSGGSAHRGGSYSGYVDHGHHAAFDRAVYLRAGGYDENFSHNEDAEYDYRIGKLGHKVYMDAGARIRYMPRNTAKGLWKQYFNYGKGRAKNLKKHNGKPRLRQIVPLLNFLIIAASIVGAGLWSAFGPSEGVWRMLGFGVLAVQPVLYAMILFGAACVGCLKLKSLCGLHVASVLFCMHNSWALGFLKGLLLTPTPERETPPLQMATA